MNMDTDIGVVLNLARRSGAKLNPMAGLKRLGARDRRIVSRSVEMAMEELGIGYQEALHLVMEIGIAIVKEEENG